MIASRGAVSAILAHGHAVKEDHSRAVKEKMKQEKVMEVYMLKRPKPDQYPSPLSGYVHFGNKCYGIAYSTHFEMFIFCIITLASLLIALDTYDELRSARHTIEIFESAILIIFTAEVALKLAAESLKPHLYFTGPSCFWNTFDFTIVVLSMPFILGKKVSALRLLRLCRL